MALQGKFEALPLGDACVRNGKYHRPKGSVSNVTLDMPPRCAMLMVQGLITLTETAIIPHPFCVQVVFCITMVQGEAQK
jgi:hypothetical protein